MQAARFYKPSEELKIENISIPELNKDEALIKVKSCGICGTDVHIAIEGTIPVFYTPIVLGHEVSGEIVKISVGTGHRACPSQNDQSDQPTNRPTTNFQVGDKVIIYPQETCGDCVYCREGKDNLCIKPKIFGLNRDGGLAEFVKAPIKNLIKLPENISYEIGAITADAVATPYHALIKRARLKSGQTVAIFGCGGLGYHAIKLCKIFGADKIISIDVNDEILKRAQDAGADEIINSKNLDSVKTIRNIAKGGVDISFEFIGLQQTIDSAVKALKKGGRCVVCGIGQQKIELVSSFIFVGCEYELLGSFGSDKDDIENVLKLVEEKKLDLQNSITETFNLENVGAALQKLHKKEGNPIRLVINI